MRKPILLAVMAISTGISAQITFDGMSMANLGDTVFLAEDTTHAAFLDMESAAGNQVWDFTSVTEDKPDGVILEEVSTAPLNALFPTADFVANDLYEDSIHLFFKKIATYLDIVGLVEYDSLGDPVKGELDGTWRFMQYPATMGTTFSSQFLSDTTTDELGIDFDGAGPHPYIDSLRTIFVASFHNEIDAWGEMQLPQGNFMTIRQRTSTIIDVTNDCYYDGDWHPFTTLMLTFFDDHYSDTATDGTYRWWTDDEKVNLFVAQVDIDTNGNPDSNMSYTKVVPTPPVGIDESANGNVKIYPNPSTHFVQVETALESGFNYSIYDVDAKLVMKGRSSSAVERINLTSLSSGIFLLQVTNDAGANVNFEKLQIVR